MKKYYYDLNVQVWKDKDSFLYSVIQEFDTEGRDQEVIAMGSDTSLDRVLADVKEAIVEILERNG